MDLQLKDKVALITGSTKGIGRAIAETLHYKRSFKLCFDFRKVWFS